jgi:hypothetical protein
MVAVVARQKLLRTYARREMKRFVPIAVAPYLA